jgi:hypothetical protein
MKRLALIAWAGAATILAVYAGATGASVHRVLVTQTHTIQVGTENLYIRNLNPRDFSDAEIKRDIPAWEHAVNVDFASYWHSTRFNLVFIGRAPAPVGAMSAVFVKKGPIHGALAYHTISSNAPAITVYSGTGAYYGYDNSVSFTHELFELAADPVTSILNIGYPSDYYWLEKGTGNLRVGFNTALGWFQEVCDPVEADSYLIGRTKISDFVLPSWFNDGVGQKFDFMGLTQQPYWIRPGGYGQFYDATGWQVVLNFRKGHPSDRGFYVGDTRSPNR